MISPDRGPAFSLTYDVEQGDLREIYAADPSRRRHRARAASYLGGWGLIAMLLTLFTVALDQPSVALNSPGAPSFMYVADAVSWLIAAWGISAVIRLSPGRMSRRAWRSYPEVHGPHRDEVTDLGVTSITPDGTEVFIPWSAVTALRETDHAFLLLGDQARVRQELPKRGLASSDLVPVLREFLEQAMSTPQRPSQERKPPRDVGSRPGYS